MMGVELAWLVGIDLLPPEACEALAWRPGGPHSHMGGGREGRRREEEKEEKEDKGLTDNGPQDILPHLGGLWLGVCFWK